MKKLMIICTVIGSLTATELLSGQPGPVRTGDEIIFSKNDTLPGQKRDTSKRRNPDTSRRKCDTCFIR